MSALRLRTFDVLFLGFAALCLVMPAGLAWAGSAYTCDTGDIHSYYSCVKADKPVPQGCQPTAGNPVDILTGRKHEEVVDWSSGGAFPLELRRTYSSSSLTLLASPYSSLGRGWRTNFDARAKWSGPTLDQADWVHIVLPDSFEYHFKKLNGIWTPMLPARQGTSVWIANGVVLSPRTDSDATLTIDGSWIVFRTPDDRRYVFDSGVHQPDVTYNSMGLNVSLLSEIRFPGGYSQKVNYDGDYAVRVTDTLGRWLAFDYDKISPFSFLISRVSTSDGTSIRYSYSNRYPGVLAAYKVDYWSLSSVTSATPATPAGLQVPRYRYEYVDFPNKPGLLLTGILDERGVRIARWTYDAQGRALSSEHAGGVDHWDFAYDDVRGTVTTTNPLGRQTKYAFRKSGGLRQLLAVDGIATAGCAASNTQYSYDARGFRSTAVDAEGRRTEWTRDARGLPLSVTEGAGGSNPRTTLMTWDAARPQPLTIAWPGLTTSFAYGASGELRSVTQTDTATQTLPYPTAGATRTTAFDYTPFRVNYQSPLPGVTPLPDVALPLVNPAAEQGVTGWSNLVGTLAAKDCGGGNPCFFGGQSKGVLAYQDVALPAATAGQVDASRRHMRLTWRQGGNGWSNVLGAVMFFDGSGAAIGAAYSPADSPYQWVNRELAAPVPRGTRTIRVFVMTLKVSGSSNDGYFDDLALQLFDNDANPAPLLAVANPFGFGKSAAGWIVQPGQGGLLPDLYWDFCPFCTFFYAKVGGPTATSTVTQIVEIPARYGADIDRGLRGLDLSWMARLSDSSFTMTVKAEFLTGAGQLLTGERAVSTSSTLFPFPEQKMFVAVIPPGARQIRLTVSVRGPRPAAYAYNIGFSGMTARLTALPQTPTTPVQLLTAVDGPLPGPSDTVRYAYDGAGNLASVSDELGHVTRVTARNRDGQPAAIIDPNGVTTSFTYDDRNRLASTTTEGSVTRFAYDLADRLSQVTRPDGSILRFERSDAGRVLAIANRIGERIAFGYNANGDVTSRSVKSASGAITRQQSALYDELGRLSQLLGAAGQVTRFGYDRTNNLVAVRDPRGGLLSRFYDGLQQLVASTDPAGASLGFTRDGQGRLSALTDARGLTTSYVRNGFGEVIQESGPDVGTTTIIRDARGRPTRITDPRGVATELAYDAEGRLTGESYPADPSENVGYFYDSQADGNKGIDRLTGIVDASGSTARYYDAQGRVTTEARVIGGRSYVLRYRYDAAGRLASIAYPSGHTVVYSRTGSGSIYGVQLVTAGPVAASAQFIASDFTWSPMSSRPTRFSFPNGLVETRRYDGDGRLAAQEVTGPAATALFSLSYAYGDQMNLTRINDLLASEKSLTLGYDAAQRLATASGPWGRLDYAYTLNGDRTQERLTPPGARPIVTDLQYPAGSNRLSATSVDGVTTRSYGYDAAGNVTSVVMGSQRLDIAYSQRNRPVMVTRSGGVSEVSRYGFNALEQLVWRRTTTAGGPAGTVHYIYGLDGSLLAEADGATGNILRLHVWLPAEEADDAAAEEGPAAPLPLAIVTGPATAGERSYMVHADHLGRPVRLTNLSGATVWAASYDPFGLPLGVTGTVEQNLRFPGQYFLLETGLAYNWHRVYDPATGRYTQPDPLRFVDGPSVYGYAGGSPLMRVDPEGLCVEDACIGEGAATLFCLRYPNLCLGTAAAVWNGCYWVLRKIAGGGMGGQSDDEDECEAQLNDDTTDCARSTKDSAMPGAYRACEERARQRFVVCNENKRGAGKELPPRWKEGKDDDVWINPSR